MLTFVLSVSNFNNSTYLGGAGALPKPASLQPGSRSKFVLTVEGPNWVPRGEKAPSRSALRGAFAQPAWPH